MDTVVVERIAHLSRMKLPAEEIPVVTEQLAQIFRLVEAMRAVPTDGVEPMAHPLDLQQPLRPDELRTGGPQRADLLANAPEAQDGLFLVPKVIE